MPPAIDPNAKLMIVDLEGGTPSVTAQFNPKELSFDRSIPWQKQKKKGPADLEYTGGEPKTMGFELLFDGFESGQSVQPEIAKLHLMSDPIVSGEAGKKRPPKVKVVWGAGTASFPAFEAVIESVAVKYTMFAPDGTALRATANVKFKEASNLKIGKAQ